MRRANWASRTCLVLALAALSTTANAAILVQGSEGQVYLVSTSTAVATLFASYPDVPGSDAFSPNGLGYNGNVFNTSFVNSASNLTLYRNGVALVQPLATTSQPTGVGVAAGDVKGNTYYYIDTDFDLYSVSNINGTTGPYVNVKIKDEMTGATGEFGDLAISGGSMFVSYGTNSLQQFDLNGILLNTITNETRRYLGLAFDGGFLYGVVDTGPTNELYRLVITGSSVASYFVNTITLNGSSDLTLTDAASVPLPAAAWLLLSGLVGFGFVARRRTVA